MSRRFYVSLAGLFVVLSPGAVYAFTILSQPLAAGFGWTPQQVNWAFALFSLFIAVGGAIGGYVCDTYGPRTSSIAGAILLSAGYALCGTLAHAPNILLLWLYYGIIAGMGAGMCYISALTAVMRWSKNGRGLAGGFVIMGFGLGSVIYGAIIKAWPAFASIQGSTKLYMDAYSNAIATSRDLNTTRIMLPPDDLNNLMSLFTVSAVVFLLLTGAAAYFMSFPDAEHDSARRFDYSASDMFGDARFYVIWMILFLNVFGGSMVISSAVPIMSELAGVSAASAAGLYSLLAICNALGRIGFGFLSDRVGRRWTFFAIFVVQAIAFSILDGYHEPIPVSLAIAMLLFAYGGGFGTVPAAVSDTFGTKNFGSNYGFMISAWGLAAVMGAYFVNLLKSSGVSYIALMQPLSVLTLVALFFPMIMEVTKKETPAPTAVS